MWLTGDRQKAHDPFLRRNSPAWKVIMRIRKALLPAIPSVLALLIPVLVSAGGHDSHTSMSTMGGALPSRLEGVRVSTPEHIITTLYAYPGVAAWNQVIKAAPTVSASIVDMCAADGSGSGCNQQPWDEQPPAAWTTEIEDLQAAGIVPLVYIATDYGNEGDTSAFSLSTVKKEVSDAIKWYGKNIGFMFDEAATSCSLESSYYGPLFNYVNSRISTSGFVELNPGTVTSTMSCYMNAAEVVQVFEGPESEFQGQSFPSWMSSYGPSRFAATISAGTSAGLSTDISDAASDTIGNVYVDDEAEPPNYSTLPAFWSTEVADVAGEECPYDVRLPAPFNGAAIERPASRGLHHRAC
jgi:hypothetical protein